MMAGVSRIDGAPLSDFEDLRQSIVDILTTPTGWRSHREGYGSNLPRRVDEGMRDALGVMLVADVAEALSKTVMGELVEPRFLLRSVAVTAQRPGVVVLTLTGEAKYAANAPAERVVF